MGTRYLTSEAVGAGHPDKICDLISDSVLDYFLARDRYTRAGIEVLATHTSIVVAGELKSEVLKVMDRGEFDLIIERIVRKVLREIGYIDSTGQVVPNCGINPDFEVINLVKGQSPDISIGVDQGNGSIGAGDQGMMFGYATDETVSGLPYPYLLANQIMYLIGKRVSRYASNPTIDNYTNLLPDGKCQVTCIYEGNKPVKVETVVISNQTRRCATREEYEEELKSILRQALAQTDSQLTSGLSFSSDEVFKNIRLLINPTGSFLIGGPLGDTGLTGRKIVADQYGGFAPVGGGAFSGKDASKVDRSAAYMARFLALNILKAFTSGAASGRSCNVQLAYAIGVAQPVGVDIQMDGVDNEKLERVSEALLDSGLLTPAKIIDRFKLDDSRCTTYSNLSAYGHYTHSMLWDQVSQDIQQLVREA